MAWVSIGEALEMARDAGMIGIGEEDVGASSDAEKDAGTEAPASQNREIKQETEPKGSANRALMSTILPMGRCMTVATASPKAVGSPSPVAVIHLRIIEGGGGRRQEGGASAAFRTRAGGGVRGCKLKLVGG